MNNVRQTNAYRWALVPEPSSYEVETTFVKLKGYKALGIDQIMAELITLHFIIHKLTNPVLNKEKLPQQWKDSIILPIYKNGW